MNLWLLSCKLTDRIVYIFYLIYQIMFSNRLKKHNIKSYTVIIYDFFYAKNQKKYDNFQHLRIFFNISSSNTSCLFLKYICYRLYYSTVSEHIQNAKATL